MGVEIVGRCSDHFFPSQECTHNRVLGRQERDIGKLRPQGRISPGRVYTCVESVNRASAVCNLHLFHSRSMSFLERQPGTGGRIRIPLRFRGSSSKLNSAYRVAGRSGRSVGRPELDAVPVGRTRCIAALPLKQIF